MIRIITIGDIPQEYLELIEDISKNFMIDNNIESYIELIVYSQSLRKKAFITQEASRIGVSALGDFIVMHEAWRGYPRIHIDYEEISKLNHTVVKALLIHELAHSILHGSPLYYMIRVKKSSLNKYGDNAYIYLYLASLVAKDIDVIAYLKTKGYYGELLTYAEYVMRDAGSIDCSKLEGLLDLSKILIPYIILGLSIPIEFLSSECSQVVSKIVLTINDIIESKVDFDDRIDLILERLSEIFDTIISTFKH